MSALVTFNGTVYSVGADGTMTPVPEVVEVETVEVNGRTYREDGSGNLVPVDALKESTPKGTRKGRTPAAPKATAARTPRAKASTFAVKESWKGQTPSPRMVAAMLHYGMTPGQVAKVRADKFTCSMALGEHLVKAGKFTGIDIK